MRSLFLRIFLSYWIAQALFLVLAIIITIAIQPSSDIAEVQAQQSKFLKEAVQAYQTGGEDGARRYLRSIQGNQRAHRFLFDDQGRELLGRKPPEWIEATARGQH